MKYKFRIQAFSEINNTEGGDAVLEGRRKGCLGFVEAAWRTALTAMPRTCVCQRLRF